RASRRQRRRPQRRSDPHRLPRRRPSVRRHPVGRRPRQRDDAPAARGRSRCRARIGRRGAARPGVRAGRRAAMGAVLFRDRRSRVRRRPYRAGGAGRRRTIHGRATIAADAPIDIRSGELHASEREQTMKTIGVVTASVIFALAPARAWGAGPLQRYALVVGANSGGSERPRLQYAIADAERFARVLIELGGVAPGNAILLRQPRLRGLTDGLDTPTRRAAESRKAARTEVIVYYSGHADEQGLLLGGDRYSYRTLRDQLDQIPADVRIAVLDACSSGAFTRMKSGKPRPAFLVDESSTMRGHAFLTSSSESEAAQESDRIRASYFTHYLISGFRGAADLSGDGKVTLNEAYQFAFNETLGRTVDTRGGAQHPSYDISMSGTGDVVMTDVRQTTATLVL